MSDRYPIVERLQLHLEGQQNITYELGKEAEALNNMQDYSELL